jgi:hypothetical protein
LSWCQIIDIILSSILENFIEPESPIIKFIVDDSLILFVDFNIEFTCDCIYL